MESKQPFESHERLRASIELAANTWCIPGVSPWTEHLAAINEICEQLIGAELRTERLQAFKDYVHSRLDEMGVEKEPNGEHSAAGCRIGDRLDIVEQNNRKLREALEEAQLQLEYYRDKFQETGTGNAVLAMISRTLTETE